MKVGLVKRWGHEGLEDGMTRKLSLKVRQLLETGDRSEGSKRKRLE